MDIYDDPESVNRLLSEFATNHEQGRDAVLERARAELASQLGPKLHGSIRRRIDDSDLLQEAMIDVVKRIDRFAETRPTSFRMWLRQIATDRMAKLWRFNNQKCRQLSREAHQPKADDPCPSVDDVVVMNSDGPSSAIGRQEVRQQVRQAITQLSPLDRRLIELHYFYGRSVSEVAAELQLTVEAVKSRRRRALLRLGTSLKELCEQ